MKIYRKGSSKNRGTNYILINNPKIQIHQDNKTINFYDYNILDFSFQNKHDYTIEISFTEFIKIIKLLGNEIVDENPDLISEEFSSCLREIIRIEKACIGTIGKTKNC